MRRSAGAAAGNSWRSSGWWPTRLRVATWADSARYARPGCPRTVRQKPTNPAWRRRSAGPCEPGHSRRARTALMKSRHHVKASRWPEVVLGGEPGNGIDIEVKPEPLPQTARPKVLPARFQQRERAPAQGRALVRTPKTFVRKRRRHHAQPQSLGHGGRARPMQERNCLPWRNRPGSPVQATSAGPPDSASPGGDRGEGGRVHGLVAGLALGSVGGELGAGGAQQADLSRDLGGQAGEVHSRVAGIQVQRGLGSVEPLAGTLGSLVSVGGPGDQGGQPCLAGPGQGGRVSVALQAARSAAPRSPASGLSGSSWRARSLLRRLWSAACRVSQPGRADQRHPGQGCRRQCRCS